MNDAACRPGDSLSPSDSCGASQSHGRGERVESVVEPRGLSGSPGLALLWCAAVDRVTVGPAMDNDAALVVRVWIGA